MINEPTHPSSTGPASELQDVQELLIQWPSHKPQSPFLPSQMKTTPEQPLPITLSSDEHSASTAPTTDQTVL